MTHEGGAVAGPSVTDVLVRAGIGHRVLAGAAGLPEGVEAVEAVEAVGAVTLLADGRPPPGSLLVAVWTAPRRDGALPPLEPLVHLAAAAHASGLLVITGTRRVDPGPEAVALAERFVLPLIWVDDQLSATVAVEALTRALSDLARDSADRRLALLEGLSQLLGAGVDEDSALRAARLLPVVGVRIVARHRRAHSVLVDWTDDSHSADSADALRVVLEIGDAADGTLELICTRTMTVDEGEYAGNLVALLGLWMISRSRVDDPGTDDLQDELLRAILGTDLSARETAIRRSRRSGAFPPRRTVVLVIEPFGHRLSSTGLNALSRNVSQAVGLRDGKASVMVREGGILVIVAEKVDLGPLVSDLVHRAGLPICIGVSTPVASIDRLPGGYRQAQRSTTLAQQLGRVNTMTRYTDLGFYRLLILVPEHERNRFVSEVLGPLAGDGAEQADLRRTLRVVGENRGNIKAAADRLFIHPNTLRQRIGRLSQTLGPFLDDADAYLDVYIALALHRLKERE